MLYSFGSGSDGAFPFGSMIFDSKGELYGTTAYGGSSGGGTVFQLSPPTSSGGSWAETVLYSFGGTGDGAHPRASLILGSNGDLYGTTAYGGGTSNDGTVFQLAPSTTGNGWTETVLYRFKGGTTDGALPYAPLIFGSGDLYGTTYGGGTSSVGTVFQLAPSTTGGSWTETVLYSFKGGTTDGANPAAALILGSGDLYGTTYGGGTSSVGTVFQLAPSTTGGSWTETVLHSFGGTGDGAHPFAPLILGSNGDLYGTTAYGGGTSNDGTVFKIVL